MTNPIIQTDLAQILVEMRNDQRTMLIQLEEIKLEQVKTNAKIDGVEQKLTAKIDGVEQKLTAKIDGVEQKLTAKIDGVEQKLTGRIDTLDGKFGQLDKRVGNVEFTSRGIFISIVVLIFGGIIKLLGFLP